MAADPFALAGLLISIASIILVSRVTVGRASQDDLSQIRRELEAVKDALHECEKREKEWSDRERHYIAQEARYQRQINNLMRQILNLPRDESEDFKLP